MVTGRPAPAGAAPAPARSAAPRPLRAGAHLDMTTCRHTCRYDRMTTTDLHRLAAEGDAVAWAEIHDRTTAGVLRVHNQLASGDSRRARRARAHFFIDPATGRLTHQEEAC